MIPIELLERCRGSKVLIIMGGNCEAEGVMVECDASCNILLKDASSYRTVPATEAGSGKKDTRERTGEYSLMLVPTHAVEMVVPGGSQGNIVSTLAEMPLTA